MTESSSKTIESYDFKTDKNELMCQMKKEETGAHNFGTTTVMGNRNSILIEDKSPKSEELHLIAKSNQEGEGQLLKIVEEEEEEYTETNVQHIDEILENKWLICLLKTFRTECESIAGGKLQRKKMETWKCAVEE